jgi:glycosyltransferase involved in cell wall biosynthesis
MSDPRAPEYVEVLLRDVERSDLQDQVMMLGVVPRADQIEILRRCMAVIQPSRFEGWSTVVEDARAIGRPLILSDISVHQEQAPESLFFETGSAESLARALEKGLHRFGPGPDAAAEKEAEAASRQMATEAGLAFLKIAEEARTNTAL